MDAKSLSPLVPGLRSPATPTALARLRRVVAEDSSTDLVGTARVALARGAPGPDLDIFRHALDQRAWYDESIVAALRAMEKASTAEVAGIAGP